MADPKNNKRATKNDNGKLDWSVVKWGPIEAVVKVIQLGNEEYGRDNWLKRKGLSRIRVFAAIMRHLIEWRKGNELDKSGYPHLAHAVASLLMLMYYEENDYANDDRTR